MEEGGQEEEKSADDERLLRDREAALKNCATGQIPPGQFAP